jgi:hypothetical protein
MVAVRGDFGKVSANITGGLAQISQVKEWTLTPSKVSIDVTEIGGTGFKKVLGGTVSASFTADIFYDPAATGNNLAFYKQGFVPNDDAVALFQLYTTATKFIAFSGLITGTSITGVSPGTAIMINVSGETNGVIDVSGL